MKTTMQHINAFLANGPAMLLILAFLSASALAMALIAEFLFGLAPCNLCIIQRWPFVIIVTLGLTGYLLGRTKPSVTIFCIASSCLTFFANTGVAFYHSGVERKWWPSFLEGCAVPDLSAEGSVEALIAQIESAPIVRCDEIPWADPLFGLSMANYNVVFCLALGLLSAVTTWHLLRR